ncbi:hypothetical protein ACFQZZ_11730 [Nocardia sp. GCM10030253]|uniref:hypothetical protein n=1 Tax=Nocardia sp. GCM10030253 TaxID=3273404 RepID=UPI003628FC10
MNYPQYPGGYDPYPSIQPAPNGATAIIAGVLAILGSLANLVSGGLDLVIGISDFGRDYADYDSTGLLGKSWFTTYFVIIGVLALVVAVLLGVGGVMMFLRKAVGRFVVVAGCVLVVVAGIAGFVILLEITGSTTGSSILTSGISSGIGLIFPVITATLALLPATAKWLNYDQSSAYPQPYPPARYPQAAPASYQPGATLYPQAAAPGYPQAGPSANAQAGPPGFPQAAAPGRPQAGLSANAQVGPPGFPQTVLSGFPQAGPPGFPRPGASGFPQADPPSYPQAGPSACPPEQPQVYPPIDPVVYPSADPVAYTEPDSGTGADDVTWRRPPS